MRRAPRIDDADGSLRGPPSYQHPRSAVAKPVATPTGGTIKDKTATVIYDDAKADVNQLTSATTKAGDRLTTIAIEAICSATHKSVIHYIKMSRILNA